MQAITIITNVKHKYTSHNFTLSFPLSTPNILQHHMTFYYELHDNTANIQQTFSIYHYLKPSAPELYTAVKGRI
jgi:hypothetical protein